MIFLERGRELIAAQVVEKEMLLLLLIDIILVVWGCSVNMYIVPFFYIPNSLIPKTITFKSKPKTVLLAYCVGS